MVNNIFKILYLVVFICLVVVLHNIYQKMDNAVNRFQISTTDERSPIMIDSKTGQIYFLEGDTLWKTHKKQGDKYYYLDKIPK